MNSKKDISKEIQEELEELSPKLAKISKQHPYTVPESYFDTLSDQASQMARDLGVQRIAVIRRLITVRNVAVAASIAIIAMLIWMNNFDKENGHEVLASNDVSVDEMIEYLEEESSAGLDEYDLVEELVGIEPVVVVEETLDENELTTEDIIDYLLEDNIDLGTIIDELI